MSIVWKEREKRERGERDTVYLIATFMNHCKPFYTILFFSVSCLAVAPIACSGTELDCATALCEMQAADTLAGVVGHG